MKIGLYFGTFNPIHIGHLIIANYMADFTELDQVWFVISPQNPLKKKSTLLEDYHRLAMVDIAINDNDKLKSSNIEFSLPKPSYTINTLVYLKEKYPTHEFSLIMGEDNLRSLNRWKNYEEIIANYKIFVYPRLALENEEIDVVDQLAIDNVLNANKNIIICEAPVMNVSASFIRNSIKTNKDVRYLVTNGVYNYLDEMNFYKK